MKQDELVSPGESGDPASAVMRRSFLQSASDFPPSAREGVHEGKVQQLVVNQYEGYSVGFATASVDSRSRDFASGFNSCRASCSPQFVAVISWKVAGGLIMLLTK